MNIFQHFGKMQFLQLAIWLTVYFLQFWMVRYLSKHDLFSLTSKILLVYVWFMMIVPIKPNLIMKFSNVYLLGYSRGQNNIVSA